MTEEDLKQLREFAKKVTFVFYQKATEASVVPQHRFPLASKSMLHLPFSSSKKIKSFTSLELASFLRIIKHKEDSVKLSFQVSADFLFEKRVGESSKEQLLQIAFEAHECSKNQDLQLFQRLMMKNGLSIRQIKNWKLPDSGILDACFDKMSEHLDAFYEEIKKNHEIKNFQSIEF